VIAPAARPVIGTRGKAVRLLQVTDPHLFGDESRKLYGVQTSVSLGKVIDEAFRPGTPRPAAVLATGDIADDCSPAAYALLRRITGAPGLPVFSLPGNHDDPALMAECVDDGLFQFGGTAEFGDWGAVFIDTHVPGRPEGRVSAGELARLDAALSDFGARPTMVCLHHPPVPVGSAWLDALGLCNGGEFLDVIGRHPSVRLVLGGHVHQEFETRRERVLYLATPSTCAQFTPRTAGCVMDIKPPGYRWIELQPDGTVVTEVKWLEDWAVAGRPPDDRF
jgi:Icc protein